MFGHKTLKNVLFSKFGLQKQKLQLSAQNVHPEKGNYIGT